MVARTRSSSSGLGGRRGHRVRRTLVAVLVVVALLVLLKAREDWGQQEWQAECMAQGGRVWVEEPVRFNPLVTESSRPAFTCRTVDGAVLSRRD